MKKPVSAKKLPRVIKNLADDDIRPEYDFSNGRPNLYASRFQSGLTVVSLYPDVAEVFPDAKSVNEALRPLVNLARRAVTSVKAKRARSVP